MNDLTVIYWIAFAIIIIIGVYGYRVEILNTLGRYGYDDTPKAFPLDQFTQLQQYKRLCIENNLPLTWAKFFTAYLIIAPLMLIGWILLLI